MCEEEVIFNYFENISNNYDKNNEKLYWKLSDDLLWSILEKYISNNKTIKILELGAGTGNWAYKILSKYSNVSYTLVDFSQCMLKCAETKLSKYKDRVNIINEDINKLSINEKFDIVLSIYVLPFFHNLDKLVKIMSEHLNTGGIAISVGENYYNGLALNILKGELNDVNSIINENSGKLSLTVPSLSFNKINELEAVYNKYNIGVIKKIGFPVLSLIGVEEVLTQDKNSINKILSSNYKEIYNIEKLFIQDESLVNRGKYICLIGVKNEENIDFKRKKCW